MLTAGPIGSDGGAFRLLFVNCPRVSFTMRGESVAMLLDGEGLIGVVQIGRRAGRAQSAGAARVDAVDVIEAVADAELIGCR